MAGFQEALTVLADQSPIIFLCVFVFWIQAHSYNKALKEIRTMYESSLKIIKENNNQSLELMNNLKSLNK